MTIVDELTAPAVLIAGGACLVVQLISSALFVALPKGPWSDMPGFLGHQVVAFPLMLYMAYLGSAAYFAPDEVREECAKTLDCRIHGEDPTGKLLSQIIVGMQLLWDIPTNLAVKSLWSPVMLAHHVGMCVFAYICLISQFGQYYMPFFTGVVELSSIPLAIVDIFHPTKFGAYAEGNACLGGLNVASRYVFVLSFLVIRNIMFPCIVAFQVVPDVLVLLRTGEDGLLRPVTSLVLAVAFTGLQLHWGARLVKQLVKMVKGDNEGPAKGRARRSSLEDMDLEELSGRRASVEERAAAEQL